MTPDTIAHLLRLCIARRAEITGALTSARTALPAGSPGIGSLEAEKRLNDQAITDLETQLRVAA